MSAMQNPSRFGPWINRLVLGATAAIFTLIGMRHIIDPVHAAAARGLVVRPGVASMTTRIGLGAFPLGFAIFSLVCLLSPQRAPSGVRLIATMMATVIAVRLFSLAADGATPESVRLFAPETVILLLSATGLYLDAGRQRRVS